MHSPEPWVVSTDGVPGPLVLDAERHFIAEVRGPYGSHGQTGLDAERIVACVNFLQGIPTEVLEKFKDRPVRSRFAALHCCVVLLNQLP